MYHLYRKGSLIEYFLIISHETKFHGVEFSSCGIMLVLKTVPVWEHFVLNIQPVVHHCDLGRNPL